MADCETIDARLADANELLQHWQQLLIDTEAALVSARMAAVSIMQGGNPVPQGLLDALSALQAQVAWLEGEIEYQQTIVAELEKEKKDCDEQEEQG